jgi:hypothetical protein
MSGNKMKKLLTLLAVLCIGAHTSTAQITAKIGGGLGWANPSGDFGGTTVEYYDGVKYGLSSGINLHGKARAAILGFGLVGELNYSRFSNTGAAFTDERGEVEVSQSVFSIRLGAEFPIPLPAIPIKPYIGANLAFNSINGSTKFQGISDVSSGKFDVETASRFGFGVNGGFVYSVGKLVDIDLNIGYNWINPFNKSIDTVGDKRIDYYKNLNDDADPLYDAEDKDHFIADKRSIQNLEIRATVMFGI